MRGFWRLDIMNQGYRGIEAAWEAVKYRMKDREFFVDKLKVAAACAVVLLHTVTGVLDTADMSLYPMEEKIFLILVDVSSWCVPVFLMISGYLFLDPRHTVSAGRMLTKYCRRVFLALLLFGVPYACLELIATEGGFRRGMPGEAVLMVLQGKSWSHMWYLYLIFILYLLTPGLKWVLSRIPKPAVAAAACLLLADCSILPFLFRFLEVDRKPFLPEEGIYLFYYICGYFFAERRAGEAERPAEQAGSRDRKMGGLPAASLLLVLSVMVCSRLSAEYHVQMGYNYPLTLILAVALFAGGFRGKGRASVQEGGIPWAKLADISFAVYLVHPVFLNLAYKFFHITPLSFLPGISLPLFFLGTIFLSAAAAWLLKKMPPLRKYVL